ncbi:MAG TPA: hypothetical protein VEW69_01175 [Alphaproteobacteria bacterium]|nr:hypothetical protein [Alphaproteobacteria bacterium]
MATAQKNAKKTILTAKTGDYLTVFNWLRKLLKPYEGRLAVKSPNAKYYYLESLEPTYKNRPMFFAAVRAGKSYVSFHLLPLYCNPALMKGVSPELKKRMQGKACFNFTAVDHKLFGQLRKLTQAGYKDFKSKKWL